MNNIIEYIKFNSTEISNVLLIFVLPAFCGFLLRIICKNKQKGGLISLFLGMLTALFGLLLLVMNVGGKEIIGIYTWMAGLAFITSLLTGIIIKIIQKIKK